MIAAGRAAGAQRLIDLALRAVTAAGLLIDAVIHLQLEANYQLAAPGGIGQGNLFRIEVVFAILTLLLVLALGNQSISARAANHWHVSLIAGQLAR